ncbi:MAG: peptide chain release factor N(5)-glutamine methyltransferase [Bacilli bacterium]|nr:peptide chain release factor N(5)-glutamine methyltransferase [Bacilli bacterium]
MTLEEVIVEGKKKCNSTIVKMLLASILNMNPLELLNNLDMKISSDLFDEFNQKLELFLSKKPIQYIIGNVNFYGNIFEVNENVLIPRFETEELVENTILYIKKIFGNKKINILDLCTGSGCIGLTLKDKIDCEATLSDISEKALEVALKNKESLNLDVNIVNSDLLNNIQDNFDVIISNPPYIKEKEEIEEIVINNEPHLALFGGEEGLDFYKKILSTCKKNLNSKYLIAFEIGIDQAEKIKELAIANFNKVNVDIKKDLSGKDRMIFIYN